MTLRTRYLEYMSVNVCRAAEQLDELEYEGSLLKVSVMLPL